jgi:ATP-dependent DNA ligase
VGTGFDDRLLSEIAKELKRVATSGRPVEQRPPDEASTTWIEPVLLCEVQYASITENGTLREPVFLRMRPDLSAR